MKILIAVCCRRRESVERDRGWDDGLWKETLHKNSMSVRLLGVLADLLLVDESQKIGIKCSRMCRISRYVSRD